MKLKILILFAATLVLFSSCNKEEINPVLEVFITTKVSDKWEQANFYIGNVRFIMEIDGEEAAGSLQDFNGADYNVSLLENNSKLIFNDDHFDMKKLLGLRLMSSTLYLSNADEGDVIVDIPYYDYTPLDQPVEIENGKSYKVEFILDLDEVIYEEDGELILGENYDIEITEL